MSASTSYPYKFSYAVSLFNFPLLPFVLSSVVELALMFTPIELYIDKLLFLNDLCVMPFSAT